MNYMIIFQNTNDLMATKAQTCLPQAQGVMQAGTLWCSEGVPYATQSVKESFV